MPLGNDARSERQHGSVAAARGGGTPPGVSLKAYAAEQGLSLYALYGATQALSAGGAVEATSTPGGKFAAVRVVSAPTSPMLRARRPRSPGAA